MSLTKQRVYLYEAHLADGSHRKEILRKSPEERAAALKDELMDLGMRERYATVLAAIAVKRDIDTRISYLWNCNINYRRVVENNARMLDDPHSFALQAKNLRLQSGRKFVRYGNLSYAYSNASQIQLINRLVKDALYTMEVVKMWCQIDGEPPERGEEFDDDIYYQQREKELEDAFRFDLKTNKIDNSLVETLLAKLGWSKITVMGDRYGMGPSKLMIMDSFYAFFGSAEGGEFLEKWRAEQNRPQLLQDFVKGFYNDPNVNPHLIGARPEAVGTPEFEKRRQDFFDDTVHSPDGTPHRRGDTDKRNFL
jgi:hypothetical protein